MDRRKFLIGSGSALAGTALISRAGKLFANTPVPKVLAPKINPIVTQSNDLTPYSGPWTDTTLRHLLRRAMFGVPLSQFLVAKQMGTMNAVVDKLLTVDPLPDPPGPYVALIAPLDPGDLGNPQYGPVIADDDRQRLEQAREYQVANWWLDRILHENLSIRERMTLMWSNHFVIGTDVVKTAGYAYTYNQTLRDNSLGNMKDFVTAISTDPAMLIYLNGNQNFDGYKPGTNINAGPNINENFARELQELFTLGLFDPVSGKPNYTEIDVRQAAKALTGWAPTVISNGSSSNPFVGQFYTASHNNDQKTFLGQTGNWGMDDIINIIFSYAGPDGANRPGFNTAYWYCQRIYTEFVYYIPNASVITAMANVMLDNNFKVIPVLKALLESAHFYDPSIINAQIKSPVNYLASFIRELGVAYPAFDPSDPPEGPRGTNGVKTYLELNQTLSFLILNILGKTLGQQPLQPPNVKGWPGGRNWIDTGTFFYRQDYTSKLLQHPPYWDGSAIVFGETVGVQSPSTWIKSLFPNYASMATKDMVADITTMVLNRTLGPNESASIYGAFNPSKLPDTDYILDEQETNIAAFTIALASLPEFQLT